MEKISRKSFISLSVLAIVLTALLTIAFLDPTPARAGIDGTLKWKCNIGGYFFSSPTIAPNGIIYVGSADVPNNAGYLNAINPDGTLK